jgi:putative tricarboxylic transport membrane protein
VLARDLACAVLGWVVSATVWVAASRLQRSMLSDDFGADGLPRGLALVLAIVSALVAARALWRRPRQHADRDSLEPGMRVATHARALGVAVLGFGYVLLAPWLGYLLAAFLLTAATTLYYGARFSATLVAVSLGGAVALWWVFARMLGVSMPAGFWPGLFG